MLNIGLIGSVGSIATHVRDLKNIKGIRIVGKSSVGMMEQPEGKLLTIPEFNRRDLLDAADLLIVDRSSLLGFDLLKTAVKNNRHLYITDFPELTLEQCAELLKFSEEARTVVKIRNPLLEEAVTGWIAMNAQEPAYVSLFESLPGIPEKREVLTRYLYYAMALFKSTPLKIRVTGIHQPASGFLFYNMRLEYPSNSTINLEILNQENTARTVRAAFPGKFLEGNCLTGKAHLNMQEINILSGAAKEPASFISLAETGNFFLHSDLGTYYAMLSTLHEVLRKIELYTNWQ